MKKNIKASKGSAKISREGSAQFEFFRVSASIPPEQRRSIRANKGEFFRLVFARASHKVNKMTVSTGIDQEINAILDAAPPKEPVIVNVYVYHCTSSSGILFKVSEYIVSDEPLLLPH